MPVWLSAFELHIFLMFLSYVLPFAVPSHAYTLKNENFDTLAHFWFRYDSLWFISLAQHGYGYLPGVPVHSGTVFFPWLPLLIRFLGIWPVWVLTQIAFAISLWLAFRFFCRLHLTQQQVIFAIFLLALNPAAIFFSTLYAEPWTLLFALLSIEFGHRRAWLLAGLAGGLAAFTQAIGILVGLFPLVLYIAALYGRKWRDSLGPLLWGIGCFAGFLIYTVYLAIRFGDPLLFSSSQGSSWGATWSYPWLQWLKATEIIFRLGYIKFLWLWFPITIFILGSIKLWERVRKANSEIFASILYTTVGLLVALSFGKTGTLFHSTVRISSIYFPLYAGIAQLSKPIKILAGVVFLIEAFHGAELFTHGWWFQ